MAILSKSDARALLARLALAPSVAPSPETLRGFQDGIAELRRNARRFQEQMEALKRDPDLEAVRRESRRFQEQMEALKRDPDLEAVRRESRRFQKEIEEIEAALAAEARRWRTDPYLPLLFPRSYSLKRRRAAAGRIAAALPSLAFKNPEIRAALRGWPAPERDEWLRQLFAEALVAAGKEVETPGPIRLGRQWVKDRRGRVNERVAPVNLTLPDMRRWLLQRAWRITEAILGGDVDSGYRGRLSRRDREALGEDPRGVEAMSEYRPTPPPPLRAGRLSRRERQVYDILRAGGSIADAAARLNLAPETIRTLKRRVRRKELKM